MKIPLIAPRGATAPVGIFGMIDSRHEDRSVDGEADWRRGVAENGQETPQKTEKPLS